MHRIQHCIRYAGFVTSLFYLQGQTEGDMGAMALPPAEQGNVNHYSYPLLKMSTRRPITDIKMSNMLLEHIFRQHKKISIIIIICFYVSRADVALGS